MEQKPREDTFLRVVFFLAILYIASLLLLLASETLKATTTSAPMARESDVREMQHEIGTLKADVETLIRLHYEEHKDAAGRRNIGDVGTGR